eukprot:COSAG05_NODE_15957_length_357_cov_0.624031_1_plen_20_part_10
MFKDIAHTTNSPEAFHLAVD